MRRASLLALAALLGSSVLGVSGISQGFPNLKKAASQAQKGAQNATKQVEKDTKGADKQAEKEAKSAGAQVKKLAVNAQKSLAELEKIGLEAPPEFARAVGRQSPGKLLAPLRRKLEIKLSAKDLNEAAARAKRFADREAKASPALKDKLSRLRASIQKSKQSFQVGVTSVSDKPTNAFQNYAGGVFDENANGRINHAVVIVGWDDARHAWHVRNSWVLIGARTATFGCATAATGSELTRPGQMPRSCPKPPTGSVTFRTVMSACRTTLVRT